MADKGVRVVIYRDWKGIDMETRRGRRGSDVEEVFTRGIL
jgi:hypothetical protein